MSSPWTETQTGLIIFSRQPEVNTQRCSHKDLLHHHDLKINTCYKTSCKRNKLFVVLMLNAIFWNNLAII